MSAPVRRTPYSATPVESSTAPRYLRGWWIPDLAFSAMRAAVGLLLAWHGAQELFGVMLLPGVKWAGALTAFSQPWYEAVLKLGGGTFLVFGLFTRITSLVLAVVVAVEHFAVTGLRMHWMFRDGELATLYIIVLLGFALTGSGLFSFDAWIERRRVRKSRMQVSMSPWIRKQIRRRDLTR
ncbi:MAG: DoxX family protein [Gemmatimonadaceae bacterium]